MPTLTRHKTVPSHWRNSGPIGRARDRARRRGLEPSRLQFTAAPAASWIGRADLQSDVVDAFSERCSDLAETWRWWATTVTRLDAPTWRLETRLPGWDVAALVAHASLLVRGLGWLSSQPLDTEPAVRSAHDMLRGFNAPGGVATTFADGIAEMARRQAASMTPDELVALFAVTAPEVVAALEQTGPIVIEYFGNGTFPIVEAMSIAVLEAVVHGLDLCAAVDASIASIPQSPTQHTVGLLASMAEPESFIEAATGRRSTPVLPVLR
jgi:uncharacterized protein (TIGR03083 family)